MATPLIRHARERIEESLLHRPRNFVLGAALLEQHDDIVRSGPRRLLVGLRHENEDEPSAFQNPWDEV